MKSNIDQLCRGSKLRMVRNVTCISTQFSNLLRKRVVQNLKKKKINSPHDQKQDSSLSALAKRLKMQTLIDQCFGFTFKHRIN